jgi:hypothetical protein
VLSFLPPQTIALCCLVSSQARPPLFLYLSNFVDEL